MELEKCGWIKKSIKESKPGDVVVWGAMAGGTHGHIGIITKPGIALNNSSSKGYPVESNIHNRKIVAIWSPPDIKEKAKQKNKKTPKGISHTVTRSQKRYADLNSKILYRDHKNNIPKMRIKLSPYLQRSMRRFINRYKANIDKYRRVSRKTGLPPQLIAALHYMESGGRFNTYMHNGDPLRDRSGRSIPTTHVPRGKLFGTWEESAIDALNSQGHKRALGLSSSTKDMAKMMAFGEYYNGLGYRLPSKNIVSPYVYGGTNLEMKGKYVADGKWDPNASTKQLGVGSMLLSLKREGLL